MGKHTGRAAILAAVSILVWPTIAASQQGGAGTSSGTQTGTTVLLAPTAAAGASTGGPQPGLQIDMGLKTSLKADSNLPLTPGSSRGTSSVSDTNLSFGLSSVTSAYTLTVKTTGVLRYAHIPGRTIHGLEDPILNALFIADSSNSRLTLNAHLRYVDRLFLSPFQVEQEDLQAGIISNGGTLRDPSYSLRYETGLNAPLGALFNLSHAEKNYSGVTNPRLFDTVTDRADAQATLRFNQVTTGRVTAAYTHYTAQDLLQTDRRTTDYAVGVIRDLTQTLQLDAQIGHTDVQTDTVGGTAHSNGLTGSVGLTQTMTNGTIFGTLSTTRNQNGARTTLSFGRDLALPNGNLRASIGATKGSIGSGAIIGSLAYSWQLPVDTFSVTLDRSTATNNSSQDVLNTRLDLSWDHTINSVSSVNLAVNWVRQEHTRVAGAPTIQLTNLDATYRRQLTSDWAMTSGLTYRTRTETGKLDAHSTAVFVTLGRNFSFRP